MKMKLMTTAAVLALMAGSASAQGVQQQEQGGTRTVQGQQQDQKAGESTSPAAKKEGNAPQAQGGAERRPENGNRQTQSQPSGERPGSATTQDSEKKAQQGTRENTQRQGQSQDIKKQDRAQDRQEMKKDGQAQTESKKSGSDAAAKTELNSEQRSKISQSIKTQNVKRVTNVNFNISVGTVVPRNYTFYPVPATIVTIVPAYRGYLYIVVGDQMLILHPRTYEIVAIIAV